MFPAHCLHTTPLQAELVCKNFLHHGVEGVDFLATKLQLLLPVKRILLLPTCSHARVVDRGEVHTILLAVASMWHFFLASTRSFLYPRLFAEMHHD